MNEIPFPLSQKLEINRLIEYSMDFSIWQRLNASFDWIFNEFWSFPNRSKHFDARAPGPHPAGPTTPGRKNASTD